MKYIHTLLFIITVLFSSCTQMTECYAPVSGLWANVDENGYTSHYISFENGKFKSFRSNDSHLVYDNMIWGVKESSFLTEFESFYSIEGNQLFLSLEIWDPNSYNIYNSGWEIEIDGTYFTKILCLNSEKFDNDPDVAQSEIILPYYSKQVDAAAGAYELKYSIQNPIAGYSLNAESNESWITNIKVYSDRISYNVLANNSRESRTGNISLTYGDVSKSFKITQQANNAKAEIILPYDSRQLNAAAGTFELEYSIQNPIAGYSLNAESNESWITNIKGYSDRISYNVLANNSSESRTGNISLTYGDVSKSFKITQQAQEAQIQEYSYTFKSGDLGTTGSPKSSVTLGGVTWEFSMKDNGSKFFNFESSGEARGIQIGKSADPATAVVLSTKDIPGTIKRIKVTTSGASGTDAQFQISVGGSSFSNAVILKQQSKEYDFTGNASGEIIFKWTATAKAIYIKKIVIEYTN